MNHINHIWGGGTSASSTLYRKKKKLQGVNLWHPKHVELIVKEVGGECLSYFIVRKLHQNGVRPLHCVVSWLDGQSRCKKGEYPRYLCVFQDAAESTRSSLAQNEI